jgi:hypothetical protein
MAAEMTPRPEIEITEEKELEHVVEDRKLFLERIKLETSLVFEAVFEAWRRVHQIRMGKSAEYVNHDEYLKAIEDPDPYESTYIFYCLGK